MTDGYFLCRILRYTRLDTWTAPYTETRSRYVIYATHDQRYRTKVNTRQHFAQHNSKQSLLASTE